jgi:5'-methylthioadenosine phosphorylase/5'-methylthioinosine phosphorylase
MTELAIIGGSGFTKFPNLKMIKRERQQTPYGEPSAEFITGEFENRQLIFLARHGIPHTIAPHLINYRANIWALKQLGVEKIIAISAVGGITEKMIPAHLAMPDQIIDYSYGRKHTFFEDGNLPLTHIDFTHPYSEQLRTEIKEKAIKTGINISSIATYGCTQGPRFETPAEIKRMQRDGCDIVGMTAMPEAALARELGIDYVGISVVANWAAGKAIGEISLTEIDRNLQKGMVNVFALLKAHLG